MSQRLPVDGVALTVQGAKKFIADLTQANAAWSKVAVSFDKAGNQTITASKGMDQVGTSSRKAGSGMLAMGTAAGVAMAGVNALISSIKRAGHAITETLMGSLQLAGNFQEMEFTALAVGRAMGLTEDQIRGASLAIQDEGVRADVANKTVAQFARNQLDLAKAVDLVKVAQATGIIVGEDSSATMERLTLAITTGSTARLRSMGILVDNTEIEKKLAGELNVHTDALSNQQKMQARTNAIIEASSSLMKVYDEAMRSPTKQLRSLAGRILPELQAALGAPFLGAWFSVIKAVSNLAEALTAAMKEGGALYPMMVKLGAVASIMADSFSSAVDWITNAVTGMSSDIGVSIGQTIEDALRWGVELVAAFAEGMVEASTTVLIQAMNFISSILTGWLLGASPPKIAPGIVGWGINLMDMYLRGMTEADFGILKDIQGPLKKILEGPAFADVSQALAGALAGGDRAGFLETVGKTAGIFGDAIKKLAIANFDLADSVASVQTAEDALAASRERLLSSQAGINKATVEYNRLLRAGASDAELQTQLGLINASEDNMRAVVGQVGAQENALKAAKARQDQLTEEEKLQQNIVDQLLRANDALTEKAKAEGVAVQPGGGGVLGGGIIPGLEDIVPGGFDISSRMTDAIDAMKAQMKEKLADIFAPLTTAYEEDWKPAIARVTQSWNQLVYDFSEFWTSPAGQGIKDFFANLFPEGTATNFAAIATAFGLIAGAIAAVGIVAAVATSPLGLLAGAVLVLSGLWAAHDEELLTTADQISFIVKHYAKEMGLLEDETTTGWAAINEIVSNSFLERDDMRAREANKQGLFFDTLDEKAKWAWDAMKEGYALMFSDIKEGWTLFADDVVTIVEEWTANLITEIGRLLTEAFEPLRVGLEGVSEWIGKIKTKFQEFIDLNWAKVKEGLGWGIGHSPSPLEAGLTGINKQLQVLATTRLPALASMGSQMAGAMAPMQQLSPQSNTSITNNMGGNTFNNGTSEAAFNARVEQAMRRQLRS